LDISESSTRDPAQPDYKSGGIKMIERIESESDRAVFPPTVMLYPLPVVMVSSAGIDPEKDSERPNIVTIAWAGTVCSDPPMLSVSIRKSRHSHKLITATGEFVVNLVGEDLAHACDYCGVRSGADEDKFSACGLTAITANGLQYAPAIAESPLYLSCVLRQTIVLGSHDMFIAEIVSVSVDRRLLDSNGKVCLEKAGLISYVHGDYYSLGGMLGFFGYSVASPEKLKIRMKKSQESTGDVHDKNKGKRKTRGS
jgi:flavin reductase (DIM6/NTAB) family NADH-FMN oxidoreductase RutF